MIIQKRLFTLNIHFQEPNISNHINAYQSNVINNIKRQLWFITWTIQEDTKETHVFAQAVLLCLNLFKLKLQNLQRVRSSWTIFPVIKSVRDVIELSKVAFSSERLFVMAFNSVVMYCACDFLIWNYYVGDLFAQFCSEVVGTFSINAHNWLLGFNGIQISTFINSLYEYVIIDVFQ